MFTITKQSCIKEITSSNNALLSAITIMCVLAGLRLWISTHELLWVLLVVAIYIVGVIFSVRVSRNRLRRIEQSDYYLEKDVLVRVEELYRTANRLRILKQGAQYDYVLTFSGSGGHRITLFSQTEPEEFDADYAAVHFSQPGDAFYLVRSTDKEERIIKCFPAKYYAVSEEDFDADGAVYRPKKS